MPTVAQEQKIRQSLCSDGNLLIRNAPYIGYFQRRPMLTQHLTRAQAEADFKAKKAFTVDCMESIVLLYHWNGMKDPTGRNYDGLGDTQDVLNNRLLPKFTNPERAGYGALIVFAGPLDRQHIGMVLKPGTAQTMRLFSMGSTPGPLNILLPWEVAAHPGQPYYFIDITKLF